MSTGSPVLLCVDDDIAGLATRKLLLERAGYTVLTASSAQEAALFFGRTHVDLLITDQLLSSTTGTELAAQAKQLCPALKVLIVSGLIDPPDLTHADGFLCKLDGPPVLFEKVAAVLKGAAANASGATPCELNTRDGNRSS